MMVGIYRLEMCLQCNGLLGIFGAALTDIKNSFLQSIYWLLSSSMTIHQSPLALIKKQYNTDT